MQMEVLRVARAGANLSEALLWALTLTLTLTLTPNPQWGPTKSIVDVSVRLYC